MKCCKKQNVLSAYKVGDRLILSKISDEANKNIFRRLCDLSLLPETEIVILKKSFLGKTFLVGFNGFALSFRDKIADLIEVRKL